MATWYTTRSLSGPASGDSANVGKVAVERSWHLDGHQLSKAAEEAKPARQESKKI